MLMLSVEEGSDWGAQCKVPPHGSLIVGRSATCNLVLDNERASRQHFRFEVINGRYFVTDLGSHNGTFVNEMKIAETTPITQDDRIRVGGSILKVIDAAVGTLIGKTIGGCRLEERLGSGGMGEVYRAIQISLGRTVAVKVLAADLVNDEEFVRQFLAEARAAGQFNHPNVVQVYDVGSEGGLYFYAMEYQSGGSVQQHVQGGKVLAPARVLQIVRQAASALEFAERMGIVHCDIKPENLMLSADGDVRLADLGIARRHGETAASKDAMHVAGSPHYMSPEQAKGEKLDNRSDLYALGATMYRLLAGRPPFNGNSAREVMEKQVFEDASPVRTVRPQITADVERIVMKLLQKKPDRRYQHAKELIADIDAASVTAGAVTALSETSDVARITSFRIRAANTGSSGLSRVLGLLLVCGVLGAVAYGVARHIYRADALYDRGLQLQRAGKVEDAERVFEEALYVAGTQSALGVRIQDKLAEIRQEVDRRDQTERAERAVRAAEIEGVAGGEALEQAFERVEAVSLSGAIGKRVAGDALRRLRAKLEEEADADLRARRLLAMQLATEHRYADAIESLATMPRHYSRTEAYVKARQEAEDIRAQAEIAFRAAVAKAKEIVEGAGTRSTADDDAIQWVLPFIHRSGLPEIAARAKEIRMGLEARAREIRMALDQKAVDSRLGRLELDLSESRLLRHLYDFAESRTIVRRVQNMLRDMGVPDRIAELDERVAEIARSEILFASLRAGLADGLCTGETIVLPDRPPLRAAGFRADRDEVLTRRAEGDGPAIAVAQLPPRQIVKLMRRLHLKPYDHIVLAEFCLDHGITDEAARELSYADRVRPDERAFAAQVKARAETATSVERPDENDAGILAELAVRDARAGRAEKARERLAILMTRYAKTAAASGNLPALIEKLIVDPSAAVQQ